MFAVEHQRFWDSIKTLSGSFQTPSVVSCCRCLSPDRMKLLNLLKKQLNQTNKNHHPCTNSLSWPADAHGSKPGRNTTLPLSGGNTVVSTSFLEMLQNGGAWPNGWPNSEMPAWNRCLRWNRERVCGDARRDRCAATCRNASHRERSKYSTILHRNARQLWRMSYLCRRRETSSRTPEAESVEPRSCVSRVQQPTPKCVSGFFLPANKGQPHSDHPFLH